MTMPVALQNQGFLLVKTEEELYEIVTAAMSVAAWRNPQEFQRRRVQIAKNLFSLPEEAFGLIYQNSYCTLESTTASAPQDSKPKSPSKPKIKIKLYIPNATNSKQDDKKRVDVKLVVPKTYEDKKNIGEQSLGVSTEKSESVASNFKKKSRNNDDVIEKKLEFSRRKLEGRHKQLGGGARKIKFLDFAEAKDLIEPIRDVKKSRFRS